MSFIDRFPPVERGSSLLYTGLSYSLCMCWKCLNRPQEFTLLIWVFCIQQLFILFVIANFETSYYVFCSMLSLSPFSTLRLELQYKFLHVHSTLHPSDTLIWENALFFQLEKLNYNFNDYFSLIMDYILCGHLYNIHIYTTWHKNLQKFNCSALAPTQWEKYVYVTLGIVYILDICSITEQYHSLWMICNPRKNSA